VLVVVVLTAFCAAGLTLFSGFGLGTLLLPAFALFFPLKVAVAATAAVHLANNLFKVGLLWRFPNWRVVAMFGVPAMVAAMFGAMALNALSSGEVLMAWQLGARTCEVRPDGLAIGGLVLFFAAIELHPRGRKVGFPRRFVPLGGLMSGFLGGVSGHQGALRSAFLLRLELPREVYIGTGTMCAVMVDLARIPTYGAAGFAELEGSWSVVVAGAAAAFAGSYIGRRLMKKVTMDAIHLLVGVLLVILGAAIAAGVI